MEPIDVNMEDGSRLDELLAKMDDNFVVLPGEGIAMGSGFLRGHGTYVESGNVEEDDDEALDVDGKGHTKLVASVAGVVLRVNKLISVKPIQSRYSGDIGDVVIGRVVEVGNKVWKVDLGARQHAMLMLGSINLPGGALRRRTLEDQLQMRTLFTENDLLSAEVSSFYQHGGMSIHTRSMRYGKLQNGTLVTVLPSLIKRTSQHFVHLPCGVDAIFGLNGMIWLTSSRPEIKTRGEQESLVELSRMTDLMESENQKHAERVIDVNTRDAISRVRNCILLLASSGKLVHTQSVMAVYNRTIKMQIAPRGILAPGLESLTEESQ